MEDRTHPPRNVPVPHPQGVGVLIAGIVGVWACGILFGTFAWYQGTKALREIDAYPGRYSNRTIVNIGRILGMIATILWTIIVIVGTYFYVQQPR